MKNVFTRGRISLLVIIIVLLIDQWLKIWVKTSMHMYESIHITDWFYIYFVENNGMAFGIEWINKLLLTLFRLVAIIAIAWYIQRVVNQTPRVKIGYIICLSLIFAGATGNIIDSVFYGEIFTQSTPHEIAHWVPVGEGYGTWLHGKVVDMFYFPIVDTYLPEWLPIWGGQHFIFFSPIFNFADAAISTGIIALLLFYRSYIGGDETKREQLQSLHNR